MLGVLVLHLGSLSVLRTPGKGGSVVFFVLPRSGPCLRRWTGVGVEVERPAAQRGRTTSMPTRIRRILRGSRDEEKTLWFKSSAASVRECGAGDASGRAGAQPYLGPRTKVRRHDD